MTIRPATEADLPAILAIYNDAIAHTTAVFDDRPHTMAMRREWLRATRDASLPVFVADEEAGVLGFASYGPFRAWPAYKTPSSCRSTSTRRRGGAVSARHSFGPSSPMRAREICMS